MRLAIQKFHLVLTCGVYNSYHWFKFVNFPSQPHVPAIPLHIKLFYSIGNVTLNSLNFIWFRAMIAAVQKRFSGPPSAAPGGKKGGKQQLTDTEKKRAQEAHDEAWKASGVGPDAREEVKQRAGY